MNLHHNYLDTIGKKQLDTESISTLQTMRESVHHHGFTRWLNQRNIHAVKHRSTLNLAKVEEQQNLMDKADIAFAMMQDADICAEHDASDLSGQTDVDTFHRILRQLGLHTLISPTETKPYIETQNKSGR